MGIPVNLTELDKLKEEVVQAVKSGISTDDYEMSITINKHVKMTSRYFSNGNRRVYLHIEGYTVEIYSKFDMEPLEIVLSRSEYATQHILGTKYHELRKYFT